MNRQGRAAFNQNDSKGWGNSRFWPTPLDYMLFVVREVNARLEWLKGKKWGNPAGGDRVLEARNR